MTGFPSVRPRRLRRTDTLRRLVRETSLSVDDFIYPLFVVHGSGVREEITSMPGSFHLSPDMLAAEAEVGRVPYPKLVLEMSFIKLATLTPVLAAGELLERLDDLEGLEEHYRRRLPTKSHPGQGGLT